MFYFARYMKIIFSSELNMMFMQLAKKFIHAIFITYYYCL